MYNTVLYDPRAGLEPAGGRCSEYLGVTWRGDVRVFTHSLSVCSRQARDGTFLSIFPMNLPHVECIYRPISFRAI